MSDFAYKISVVIPVYNCEKHLEKCMNSLNQQTMSSSDFQVVFINDGSKDKSDEMCTRLKESCGNVLYYKKENGGVSSSLMLTTQFPTTHFWTSITFLKRIITRLTLLLIQSTTSAKREKLQLTRDTTL